MVRQEEFANIGIPEYEEESCKLDASFKRKTNHPSSEKKEHKASEDERKSVEDEHKASENDPIQLIIQLLRSENVLQCLQEMEK